MHRKYQCLLLAAPLIVAAHLTYADYATTDTNNLHTKHIVTTSSDQQGAPLVAPSARPQVEEGFDLFITGDYLLWPTSPMINGMLCYHGPVLQNQHIPTIPIKRGIQPFLQPLSALMN
ncbi:MAG: hypothetical protein NTZ52_04130 [Chlamydiae bacterium]|nr:hypothetical protein [Chlamydiota bacterium]